MKLAFAFCLMTIIVGLAWAQNNTLCHSETIVTGDCKQRIRGFTYLAGRERCHRFRTRACSVTGNFFHSRDECKLKCIPESKNSNGENGFVNFMNRAMSQVQDMLQSLVNYASMP